MPPFPCIPIPLLFTIGWQDTSIQPSLIRRRFSLMSADKRKFSREFRE